MIIKNHHFGYMNKIKVLIVFIIILVPLFVKAQKSIYKDPDSARIITSDIDLFWNMFDMAKPTFDKKIIQKEYLDKGTVGLKAFVPMRIESAKNLSAVIKMDPKYYEQIRLSSISIKNKTDSLNSYFHNLKRLYPDAVFPDVYFVMAAKNSGGTTFKGGLLIGAEMFGLENQQFKPRINIGELNNIVIHELIHYQQNYVSNNTLLAQCIKEGTADFICELITGSHSNKSIYKYAEEHKTELINEFKKNMYNSNWSPWLYSTKDKSRPQDIGYWVGYTIVKSYYEKSSDKAQAIKDILNIKDFDAFIKAIY
jgi:Predicted Zn-dependent protease (DUF2268)